MTRTPGDPADPDDERADLPLRPVSVNQLVGYNLAAFRRAAGLTQEELGARLGGWSGASVSAAERSWDGKRVRKFDADELVSIAAAIGVPVIALFLPPEDDGTRVRYLLEPDEVPAAGSEMKDLFSYVMPEPSITPAMVAYRRRLAALAGRYSEPEMDVAEQVLSEAREHGIVDPEMVERFRRAMGGLIRQRTALEQRVDDLRAFENEYRSRLLAYLYGQIRDLDPTAPWPWPETMPPGRPDDGGGP